MLWRVYNKYEDGSEVDQIVASKTPITQYPIRDKIVMSNVNRFKYRVEIHPETECEDIDYVNPYAKPVTEVETWKVESNSGTYKVTLSNGDYKCNCMGYARLKDKSKGCKHIIQIKTK